MSSGINQRLFSSEEEGFDWFESPNHTGTPERRLLLAILERAILDLVGNESAESEAAQQWLFEGEVDCGTESAGRCDDEERVHEPFSIGWVCHHLDLNTKDILEHIRSMPKRGSNRVAPWYFMKDRAGNSLCSGQAA